MKLNRLFYRRLWLVGFGLQPLAEGVTAAERGAPLEYTIQRGDTLSSLCLQFFGDASNWPKIWSYNNGRILNPHLIIPGNIVRFRPIGEDSLPEMQIADSSGSAMGTSNAPYSATAQGKSAPKTLSGRPVEFRHLPRQRWEMDSIIPPTFDRFGILHNQNTNIKYNKPTMLPSVVTTDRFPILGEIVAARESATLMGTGDQVFIDAEQGISVGSTYTIVGSPNPLLTPDRERRGLSYSVLGEVRINSVRDGRFTGTIMRATGAVFRGSYLIKDRLIVKKLTPVPGTEPLQAQIFITQDTSAVMAGTQDFVYLDRGTEDGVVPGMIFRVYQKLDPHTGMTITESNALTEAEVQVLHSTEKFSTATVTYSRTQIVPNTVAVLLTSKAAISSRNYVQDVPLSDDPFTLDELDALDKSVEMGTQEEDELKQLERWDENSPELNNWSDPDFEPEPEKAPLPPEELAPEDDPEEVPLADPNALLDTELEEMPEETSLEDGPEDELATDDLAEDAPLPTADLPDDNLDSAENEPPDITEDLPPDTDIDDAPPDDLSLGEHVESDETTLGDESLDD